VDHDRLVDDVARCLPAHPCTGPSRTAPDGEVGRARATVRPVDLVQVALGWRAPSMFDDRRAALALLNHVLGSGPSSRLFQTVREDRGLTYAISSSVSQYVDAGALTVGAGCTPPNAEELLRLVLEEVGRIVEQGVTEDELARAQRSLRGSILLGLEDPGSRASRLGVGETLRGAVIPVEEQLRAIESVELDDVAALAREVLGVPPVVSLVGPGGLDRLVELAGQR
jgi:predicted Zn-dependent peptidase